MSKRKVPPLNIKSFFKKKTSTQSESQGQVGPSRAEDDQSQVRPSRSEDDQGQQTQSSTDQDSLSGQSTLTSVA